MDSERIRQLFRSLNTARWDVAHRTYGSSHATLIGLIVEWWITQGVDSHSVIDAAPSFGTKNAGWADILLCFDDKPFGVVEVEGSDPLVKLKRIQAYFETERSVLSGITLGILLRYAYAPFGRGAQRAYKMVEEPEVNQAICQSTAQFPETAVFLMTLDKRYNRFVSGIRSTVEYYSGTTNAVRAMLFSNGTEVERRVLFESANH